VQMMYREETFPFRDIPECNLKVLELPYEKEELSMFILLPNETQDGSDPLQKHSKKCCEQKEVIV
ncbi:serpin family protein, partial [Klebsiella pneumoniae]